MRHIRLTEEQKLELEKLKKTSTNSVVRNRSLMLLLSNKGHSLVEVAKSLSIHWNTVSRLLDKWERASINEKLLVLYSAKGQGAKVKLRSVKERVKQLVEEHNRNLKPILDILEKEHEIKVCKLTLQTFLKGTGLYMEKGSSIVKRQTRPNTI